MPDARLPDATASMAVACRSGPSLPVPCAVGSGLGLGSGAFLQPARPACGDPAGIQPAAVQDRPACRTVPVPAPWPEVSPSSLLGPPSAILPDLAADARLPGNRPAMSAMHSINLTIRHSDSVRAESAGSKSGLTTAQEKEREGFSFMGEASGCLGWGSGAGAGELGSEGASFDLEKLGEPAESGESSVEPGASRAAFAD